MLLNAAIARWAVATERHEVAARFMRAITAQGARAGYFVGCFGMWLFDLAQCKAGDENRSKPTRRSGAEYGRDHGFSGV